ncbi:MAG TPA: hypothetical protein DD417_04600 [Elusimicrobia bacterium]|nr:hypothetical protein [Elusimicrobiota bacterium]
MDPFPDNTAAYARLRAIAEGAAPRARHSCKVGLIVPPSGFVVPNGWEFVHTAPFEGPSVIAAVWKGLGLGVEIVDCREAPDPERLAGGRLKGFDWIAVATYEDGFPFIQRAVAIAKAEAAERPVILGGPLVTSVPKLIMENTRADYAVLGEGELTVIELTDLLLRAPDALPAGDIRGLAWRDAAGADAPRSCAASGKASGAWAAGALRVNPRRPQMHDLDAVPLQDFSAWPAIGESGQVPEIYMTSSRGCSGSCSFCYRAMPALRHKSPARVRRELLALKKHGYRYAWWSDLTFVDDKARVQRLLDEAFAGIDFRWSCFTRADGVDLPILEKMRDRGCDIVMYGFESLTEEILENFRKRVTRGLIIEAIALTRKAGLKIGGLFIVGGPGESEASLRRTIDFCREFKEVTRVKYMSAIPGTPLYHDALKSGLIKDELAHLRFLARERSVEDDEILNFTGLPEAALRRAYREINHQIEVRPYEYWNPANRYTEQGKKFQARPRMETP